MATGGIGNLTVFLGLDAAEFTRGLTKAQAEAQQSSAAMQKAFIAAGAAIGGALSATAFVGLIKGSIDAADHLDDLSKKTGVAVETLGGIGFAASQAGGDLESATAATGKLNKSLAEAAAGNEKAGEAFKLLGINVKDASGNTKTADKALVEIADKFASFQDGPEKAALALRIFGKAGADIIPLLDDGGRALQENIEYYQRFSGVTAETAKAADEFNDTLGKLNLISKSFGTTLAAELLPSLQAIADELLRSKEQSGAYAAVIGGFKVIFETVAVVAANLAFVLQQVGKGVIAVGEAALAVGKLDFSGAKTVFSVYNAQARDARASLDAFERRVLGLNDKVGGGRGSVNPAFAVPTKATAPRLGGDNGTTAKAVKDISDFDRIYKQVNGTLGEAVAQFDALDQGLGKVDQAHITAAKIAQQLQAGELKLTETEIQQIDATLKQQSAIEQATEALRLNIQAAQESANANAAQIESLMRSRDAFENEAKNAEDAVKTYGLTREALDALSSSRDRETAAKLRSKADQADEAYLTDVANLYRQQADAIDRTAAARDRLSGVIKATQEATQLNDTLKGSFESAFVDFSTGAKSAGDAFRSFADGVVAGLARIAAQKAAEEIFGAAGGIFGGNGSSGGTLGSAISLFSGFFADGGYIPPGRFGIVGERGPELAFGGNSGKTIQPMSSTSSRTNYITVNVPAGARQEYGTAVGAQVARQLAIADRRNN